MSVREAAVLQPRWQTVGGHETRIFGAATDPDVVLLNAGPMRGWTCGNGYAWEGIIAALDARLPTVAVEPLGHGRSGLTTVPRPKDMADQVDHLAALLQDLPKRPRHLVGHDEAGAIALQLSWDHPNLVASLTLISPLALMPTGDAVPSLVLSGRLFPPMSFAGQRWMLEHQSVMPDHAGIGRFLAESASLASDLLNEGGPAALEPNRALVASYAKARAANFARLRESAPAVPVLVVTGADDRIAPFDNVRALFGQMLPNWGEARLHAINRAGYYPFREQPGACLSALEAHFGTV